MPRRWPLQSVTTQTPDRVRNTDNLAREKCLASLRLEDTTRSHGLVQRTAQRLLALTLDMLLNAIHRRPPRTLAAYDGR